MNDIMLNEIIQSQKNKYYVIPLTRYPNSYEVSKVVKIIEKVERQLSRTGGERRGNSIL